MARRDDIVNLLDIHRRRLAILQQQQARLGYSTPPHMLMEIEDINAEVARLQQELAVLPDGPPTATAGGTAVPAGTSFTATKRNALEDQLRSLTEEYQAASAQWSRALGEVERVRLKRQMDDLETRIQQVEGELARLEISAPASSPAGPIPSPSESRTLRVFLSHASEDKPQVREVHRKLMEQGFDAWLDEEKLLPGQDWQLEIRKAVRSADVVIVFLSKRAVTKAGYVQREMRQALDVADEQPEGAIFLIPVKLEPCDVPDRLRHVQWVDLHEEWGWDRLLSALKKRAQRIDVDPA